MLGTAVLTSALIAISGASIASAAPSSSKSPVAPNPRSPPNRLARPRPMRLPKHMRRALLNIADAYGEPWNCQFNPFNASDEFSSFGPVYEELVYQDTLESGAPTPWLATTWTWSNDNTSLTFAIRSGVTWSDGKPFTARDVLYTFDLLKKYPALDLNSDWSVLTSVSLRPTRWCSISRPRRCRISITSLTRHR